MARVDPEALVAHYRGEVAFVRARHTSILFALGDYRRPGENAEQAIKRLIAENEAMREEIARYPQPEFQEGTHRPHARKPRKRRKAKE